MIQICVKQKSGFSMIEVIASILVISALVALSVPNYQQYIKKMKASEGNEVLVQVLLAQTEYYQQHGYHASDISDLDVDISTPSGFEMPVISNMMPAITALQNPRYTLVMQLDGQVRCVEPLTEMVCDGLGYSTDFVNNYVEDEGGPHLVCGDGNCVGAENCANCESDCHPCGEGGGCFLEGTQITMADGTQKPIEDMQLGDMVMSYDESTREIIPDKVTYIFNSPDKDSYYIINDQMKVTADHRVLSENQWIPIGELGVGDTLTDSTGNPVVIDSMKPVMETVRIYNFEVNPTHTYIADGVIVHNIKTGSMTTILDLNGSGGGGVGGP